MSLTAEQVAALMRRCQRGTGPRSYGEPNNLHAACYGALGYLSHLVDEMYTAMVAVANLPPDDGTQATAITRRDAKRQYRSIITKVQGLL